MSTSNRRCQQVITNNDLLVISTSNSILQEEVRDNNK